MHAQQICELFRLYRRAPAGDDQAAHDGAGGDTEGRNERTQPTICLVSDLVSRKYGADLVLLDAVGFTFYIDVLYTRPL